jgi:hypothetical protein
MAKNRLVDGHHTQIGRDDPRRYRRFLSGGVCRNPADGGQWVSLDLWEPLKRPTSYALIRVGITCSLFRI